MCGMSLGNAVDARENRDMKYMGYMRDTVEAHGAFARVFVLGKRWAWDSQVCTATSAMLLRAIQAEGYEVYGGYEGRDKVL